MERVDAPPHLRESTFSAYVTCCQQPFMNLSLRYYVLLLGPSISRLFEGDREKLTHIEDARFPFESPATQSSDGDTDQSNARQITFLLRTDQRFSYYYRRDSRLLVLIGQSKHLDRFELVSARPKMILGKVDGDFSTLSQTELSGIAWPVVKAALAGETASHLEELQQASNTSSLSLGIEAVEETLLTEGGSSLFVDEDYRLPPEASQVAFAQPKSQHNGKADLDEDAVDIVIEKVLSHGGNVIFLDTDSMMPFKRMALLSPSP